MLHCPAAPWTRPSASPRPPAVSLTLQWNPGTGALLPYAAAKQQVNIVLPLEGGTLEREINKKMSVKIHDSQIRLNCSETKQLFISVNRQVMQFCYIVLTIFNSSDFC